MISAILWYFLTGVDRLFLEKLGDTKTLGLYNIGLQIAGYMTIFYTTLANTFEPDIYQAIAQGRIKKLCIIFLSIMIPVVVLNLLFIVLAPYLIGVLTANRYIESSVYAQILSLHNITMAGYYLVVKLLLGYGFVKQELFVRVCGAALSVFVFHYCIEKYQFVGAAWGQVLSFFIISILGFLVFFMSKKKK